MAHSDYDLSIVQLEAELDVLHPTWDAVLPRENGVKAKGTPFNELPYARLARTKWVLKRRLLLLQGRDDWGVLVTQDRRHPNKCYAHPVPPMKDGTPSTPDAPQRLK